MLNPDYRDILSAFTAERVEFLLVGAYALAAHGAPRATRDIDLWIRPSSENAHRAWLALARFGAPLQDIHEIAYSGASRPLIPFEGGHPFRWKPAADSVAKRPPIPVGSRPLFRGPPESVAAMKRNPI